MPEHSHREDEALIAELADHPGMAALRRALARSEEQWLSKIAATIRNSRKPIDQRDLDRTNGYFTGAAYWVGERVTKAKLTTEEES
jgi:hypothetical protein